MISFICMLLYIAVSNASVLRRADPGFQIVPATAKPPNTFHNGAPLLAAEPKTSTEVPSEVYGVRSIDIPFGRLYHGDMKYFSAGQLNTPDALTDKWLPGENDYANQSACGIPDNAFSISKVAIHPYFLKYADLSRFCMQDVCISFWRDDGGSDMMLKVTDICSIDPNDPSHCASPADIKIDRAKCSIMQGLPGSNFKATPQLASYGFPGKTWWFFTKCFADGLAQPAYQGTAANWFTTPPIMSNVKWSQQTQHDQWVNNQASYPSKGWPTYPNGAYDPKRDDATSPPISDWVPGQEPKWCPVAGGWGWGNPDPSCGPGGQAAPISGPANGTMKSKLKGVVPAPPPPSAPLKVASKAPKPAGTPAIKLNAKGPADPNVCPSQ